MIAFCVSVTAPLLAVWLPYPCRYEEVEMHEAARAKAARDDGHVPDKVRRAPVQDDGLVAASAHSCERCQRCFISLDRLDRHRLCCLIDEEAKEVRTLIVILFLFV